MVWIGLVVIIRTPHEVGIKGDTNISMRNQFSPGHLTALKRKIRWSVPMDGPLLERNDTVACRGIRQNGAWRGETP
jgi:hypothetical protein